MIRDNEDLLFKEWSNHLVESGEYSKQEVSEMFCPDGLHMTGNPIRTNNGVWTIMPDFQEEELWKHSMRVAAGCEYLANLTKVMDADEAFISGFVHDVGKTVLHMTNEKLYSKVVAAGAEVKHK